MMLKKFIILQKKLWSVSEKAKGRCFLNSKRIGGSSIVGQMMAQAALSAPASYIAHNLDTWKSRRDLMYEGMKDLDLDLWSPEGAFYVLPKFKNSSQVVNDLYYTYQVITYDGAWFGAPGRVRFSYALDASKITEGLRRLKEFIGKEYADY